MSRVTVRVAALSALALAVAAGTYYCTRPQPVPVALRAVDRGTVESTVANTRAGTVKACRRARVSPQAGGRVSQLPVRRGDRVEAGALLLELWNEDLKAQVQLAENEARASEARQEQSCLAADLARRESDRVARLFRDGIVGEQMLDRAQAERDTLRAACAAGRAAADEARARVHAAHQELAKSILRAPFAGVIAELNAELGEVVTPSPPGIPTPPAVDLIEEGCLYVVAPIDEVDAPRVQPGQPARVSLDAFPGRHFAGVVRSVAPYVLDRERQARTVDVEVDIADPELLSSLVAGYSADVEVLLEKREGVVRVPTEAVYDGDKVLVLQNGLLAEKTFQPGISNWQYTEVVEGLTPGDNVVTTLDREGVEAGALAVPAQESGA